MDFAEFKADLVDSTSTYLSDRTLIWALAVDMESSDGFTAFAQNLLDEAETEPAALDVIVQLRESIDKTLQLIAKEVRIITLQKALEARQFDCRRKP